MVDPEIDDAFANAEPPTHDDWIATQLVGDEKRYVRALFAHLRDRLKTFARPVTPEVGNGEGIPLGAASADFANLVASAQAAGGTNAEAGNQRAAKTSTTRETAGSGKVAGGGDAGAKQAVTSLGSIEELGEPHYGDFERQQVLLFPFRILRALPGAYVAAKVTVGVDENHQSETEPPEGSSGPELLGWLGPNGDAVRLSQLPTQGRIGQRWQVAILPVPDTVTMARLVLETSSK